MIFSENVLEDKKVKSEYRSRARPAMFMAYIFRENMCLRELFLKVSNTAHPVRSCEIGLLYVQSAAFHNAQGKAFLETGLEIMHEND